MGIRDIRPFSSILGGSLSIRTAPMNASETFLPGELIFINTDGEAQAAPIDGTQILLAETGIGTAIEFGVAVNGPGAVSSAARPFFQQIHPDTGNFYATGDRIWYYPAGEGNLFVAPFLVAGGAGGRSVAAAGANNGTILEITYEAASTPDAGFGVELTAGVAGTDLLARVHSVLDSNFRPISATATNGAFAVFEIVNNVS